MTRCIWVSIVAAGLACSPSESPTDPAMASDGIDPSSQGTGGDGPSEGTTPADESSGDDSGLDPIFDVGAMATSGDVPTGGGCERVDVIFAVDNSGSMSEEHEALRGPVFDAFPQALLDINNGIDDFQLGVIDACPKPALFHDWGTTGACDFSTGANFMASTSPALAAEFACVTSFADRGYNDEPDACIDGGDFADDDEQPGLTAAQSVSAENLAAANTDFVRDDAILFIVTITDEDEEVLDVPSVAEIYDRIIEAKGGDVKKVVYLGIAGDSSCEGPYGSAKDATQSKALTQLFVDQGQGMFWDLCQGDLETAFATAISTLVDETCQVFVPPG